MKILRNEYMIQLANLIIGPTRYKSNNRFSDFYLDQMTQSAISALGGKADTIGSDVISAYDPKRTFHSEPKNTFVDGLTLARGSGAMPNLVLSSSWTFSSLAN